MSTDLEKLQGTWHVASLEADGRKVSAGQLGEARVIVNGSRFTSTGMGSTYEGTLALRQTGKLKAFDLLFTAGPEKGNRNLGIYRLKGDRWTICLSTRGTKRPVRFATKPGAGLALETLEREREPRKAANARSQPARKAVEPDTSRIAEDRDARPGPPTELEGEWTMVSAVFDGAPMDQKMVAWCKRITRGCITRVVAGPQTMLEASFVLDSTTRPRSIDYVNRHGAAKGKAQAGIYELSSGTLTICMSPPGRPRPTDFSSKSGDGRSYTAWRLAVRQVDNTAALRTDRNDR